MTHRRSGVINSGHFRTSLLSQLGQYLRQLDCIMGSVLLDFACDVRVVELRLEMQICFSRSSRYRGNGL